MKAVGCPACGHPFVAPTLQGAAPPQQININQQQRLWSPGVAAVLSFLIPGLGQIYKTQIISGIVWLIIVPVGYVCFIIPGLILHLLCIIGATMGDPYKRSGV